MGEAMLAKRASPNSNNDNQNEVTSKKEPNQKLEEKTQNTYNEENAKPSNETSKPTMMKMPNLSQVKEEEDLESNYFAHISESPITDAFSPKSSAHAFGSFNFIDPKDSKRLLDTIPHVKRSGKTSFILMCHFAKLDAPIACSNRSI